MTLLHTMSLAGSVAVGVYLMSFFLTKRYLPILWHKIYLTVNIFLFFMPVAYLKKRYMDIVHECPILSAWFQNKKVVEKISNYSIYVYQEGICIPNLLKYIILLVTIFIAICGLIFFFNRYCTVYRKITREAVQFDRGGLVLNELEKERRIHIKSKVYLCKEIKAPITIGTIHRKIVLPDVAWENSRLIDVLHHELIHVRIMDNFFKMLLLLVVILNFYNPLVYYLWYRWNLVTELYCDYKVTENKSIQETGRYAKLIIDFAEMQKTSGLPIVGLSISEKQLKERIEHLKNLKMASPNYGKMGNVFGTFVMIAVVFVSSLTAFAYDKTQIVYSDLPYENLSDVYFANGTREEAAIVEEDLKYDAYDKYAHADLDTFFVSETGVICYEVYTETEIGQKYAKCNHIWTEGTVGRHQKNGNDGCDIDYYNGKQCTECKGTICGNFVRTSIYGKCPH